MLEIQARRKGGAALEARLAKMKEDKSGKGDEVD
jgi:hypothetical protein